MTSNPRKPGFRLPWAADAGDGTGDDTSPEAAQADGDKTREQGAEAAAVEASGGDAAAATAKEEGGEEGAGEEAVAPGEATADSAKEGEVEVKAPDAEALVTTAEAEKPAEGHAAEGEAEEAGEAAPAAESAPAAEAAEAAPAEAAAAEAAPAEGAPSGDFMRELVSAMRGVADQARQNRLGQLRAGAEEQVQRVQASSEERAAELRRRMESDVAGIGEWAKAEAERIRTEAENRVAGRRSQLDQQLASETRRAEQEVAAVRARVGQYERELDVYYTQLAEITDPAAFAAAAKRIPGPPSLSAVEAASSGAAPTAEGDDNAAATTQSTSDAALAGRLAELDARLEEKANQAGGNASRQGAAPPVAGAGSTAIIVKGLASFGAITGFRQALAAVDGIDGVQLSLGPTGEFVYRATHAEGFDVGAAINRLEGDQAKVERDADGTLRVTVTRGR